MPGMKPTHTITIPNDELLSSKDYVEVDDTDEGLNGGRSENSCMWWIIIGIILVAVAAGIVIFLVVRHNKDDTSTPHKHESEIPDHDPKTNPPTPPSFTGGAPAPSYTPSHVPENPYTPPTPGRRPYTPSPSHGPTPLPVPKSSAETEAQRKELQKKVVMVSWGGPDDNTGMDEVHSGTGLIATFKGKTGVLTNFHVLPSAEDAGSYGRIHANYTGTQKMSFQQIMQDGIHLNPDFNDGGFYYTGGVETSGRDWSFVGFDWEAFHRRFPDITPYDLSDTTVASVGEQVTIWHHGNMRPRRMVHTTVWDDTGLQGKLAPEQDDDPNKTEPGSSGSPIWRSADNKLMGVFWGCMTDGYGHDTADRFVVIDAVLSQLNAQMDR